MIFDMRTYLLKPGWMKEHMALYEEFGRPPQVKHLGEPLFYGITETGQVNSYVHIWVYHSAGDRETKRGALFSDPAWLDYMRKSRDLGALIQQDNRIMTPAQFYQSPVHPR